VGSFYLRIQRADLEDLVSAAKSKTGNDSPEMNEIIRRFDGLAGAVAKGITPDRHLRDDLANAARMAVVSAVRKHTAGQSGFPSYVKAYMIGAAKRELGHWVKGELHEDQRQVGLDDEIDADALLKVHEDQPPAADRTWGSVQMTSAVGRVTPEQQNMLHMRFIDDMLLGAIADATGTTESAVSQRLGTALRTVQKVLAA
jgi:RNA polymerase sigma factor (sigma-70 family)